jgi:hypothetical protein
MPISLRYGLLVCCPGYICGSGIFLRNIYLQHHGPKPIHDYEAWLTLKRVQVMNIAVPQNVDIKAERTAMEVALRKKFGTEPMSYSADLDMRME